MKARIRPEACLSSFPWEVGQDSAPVHDLPLPPSLCKSLVLQRRRNKRHSNTSQSDWGCTLQTTSREFPAFGSHTLGSQVLRVSCGFRVELSAMEGWGRIWRLWAKCNLVVFDHSKPTRKNTPICKSPWSKNITALHRNPGNARQENGTPDLARGTHTHNNKENSMQTAAALTHWGDWFLDLTLKRTKTSQLITRQSSGKLGLRHLTNKQK